ncbi:hypothetical protein O1M63_04695 [Streptomyces mirabilis]|nr:hypothetical protein [Streptomyces mirabilis]
MVGEREKHAVQDAALVCVEDLQPQTVVLAGADGAGEPDPQA